MGHWCRRHLGCSATIFMFDWKIGCNYQSVQGKSRTDGQRWARPRKRNAIIFWSDCQDLVLNTRCDGFQERVMKRKERDVMVRVCEGSALPHTPLSSIFYILTCYSFELCALSGLSPHVQYDQFRPCRTFLFHFCPEGRKNFHFQQRNKMDFHFGRKKDFHFGSWSLCNFHFQEGRNESHFHFRFFLDACGK